MRHLHFILILVLIAFLTPEAAAQEAELKDMLESGETMVATRTEIADVQREMDAIVDPYGELGKRRRYQALESDREDLLHRLRTEQSDYRRAQRR